MAIAVSRKQRLQALEKDICKLAEAISENGIAIGLRLCEIRDDELWADEYQSWNQYLQQHVKELVSKSFAQAQHLIRSAEVSKKLPASIIDNTRLGPTHLAELARLAPNVPKANSSVGGVDKDYSQLRTQDVARVLKAATLLSKNGDPPSVRDIRKAVDNDLGVKKVKEKSYEDDPLSLPNFLQDQLNRIESITLSLAKVTPDAWELLAKKKPTLAKRLAEACDELAELLRS